MRERFWRKVCPTNTNRAFQTTLTFQAKGSGLLGFIQVLTELEAEYDAHVPDEECWDIKTLDDLANAIVRNQGGAEG